METQKWYATHVVRREPLIFTLKNNSEKDISRHQNLGNLYNERRKRPDDFPRLDEPVLVRHFYRLEKLNYSWESGLYPLGSCTMKYNPILNEYVASSEIFADLHPALPDESLQGALRITYETQEEIRSILDLAAVTLQPAAGAHGELTAVFMIKAYFADPTHQNADNTKRDTILIPESAHGTNPASAAMGGFKTRTIKSAANGLTDLDDLRQKCNSQVAAFMITNPNTIGVFEKDILIIKKILDQHGILLFVDGANLNAVLGKVSFGKMGVDLTQLNLHKTFSTPHGGGGPGQGALGVSERMLAYLPGPHVKRVQAKNNSENISKNIAGEKYFYRYYTPSKSIGRVKSFYSQFGNVLRAWTYLKTYGNQIHLAAERAVLNANYLRENLKEFLHLASQENSLHEVVFSQKTLKEYGLTTMNLAKFLLDHGFYAPTVYFPLHVDGAIMIEPTESESKLEMDRFIFAVKKFFALARQEKEQRENNQANEKNKENDKALKNSPHKTFVRHIDDVLAARNPILTIEMKAANETKQ